MLASQSKIRVLFTISYLYLPQSRAGTETNTDQLCRALQAHGHDVAVLAGLSRRSFSGIWNCARCLLRFTHCGPPDHVCGYPVFRSPHGVTDLRQSLSQALTTFKPDVVVTQHRYAVDLAHLAQSKGVPAIVYIHGVDFEWIGLPSSERPPVNFLANSRYSAMRLFNEYGIKYYVIHNIFDPLQYITPLAGEYVTFINPHYKKGIELVFELAERCPNIPFLFVGSYLGLPDEAFKRKADATANISWIPTTADMRSIYRKTKILLVPSRVDETWGRVVTEAQFSGIPVLASNRGGLPESVGDGGILIPDDDVCAWQGALEDLWCNDRRWSELSKEALRHAARDDIQPTTVIGQFLETINEVKRNSPI